MQTGAGGTAGASALDDDAHRPVYMGRSKFGPEWRNEVAGSGGRRGGVPMQSTKQEAKDMAYSETFNIDRWRKWLIHVGAVDPDEADYSTLRKWWEDSIDEAADWLSHGRSNIDPYAAAAILAGRDPSDATAYSSAGARERAVNQSFRSRAITKSLNLTDPDSARAIINGALSKYLGRDATDEEITAYTQALNESERKSPVVTTTDTTTSYDSQGRPTTTVNASSQKGGVSDAQANQMATDRAQALPDYGAYQAATTYASALFQALGAPV
jgi:hypothetical protein